MNLEKTFLLLINIVLTFVAIFATITLLNHSIARFNQLFRR